VDTAELRVGLLGPLDVRAGDGTPIAVPAGKSATLLAALALAGGGPVTVDALADRLWREEPPKDVRASLQNHVNRLRRLLGSSRIRTTASGYALEADVDVPRFRRLSAEAAASDDPEAARALLDEAIQLWRGEPLAGLPAGAFDRDEVPRLVEERLDVLKRRIDLDLAAGRHEDVVPLLRDLTGRHPLREQLWQQLIVALAAGGRHAEAIEAYHHVRGQLSDELGVDPSPDLQRLFHGLLTVGPAAGPAPSRLPVPPTRLIGREDDLTRLIEVVRRTRLVTAVGPGGVGKTRLALEAARSIAGDFADGVTFVPLANVRDAALFADAVASAMALRWESGRPARDVVAEHLARAHCLLLLDNLEHVMDAAPEVSALLAACPNLRVLVTSRAGLRVRGEQRFPIAPLDLDAAVELFCELASAARPSARLPGQARLAGLAAPGAAARGAPPRRGAPARRRRGRRAAAGAQPHARPLPRRDLRPPEPGRVRGRVAGGHDGPRPRPPGGPPGAPEPGRGTAAGRARRDERDQAAAGARLSLVSCPRRSAPGWAAADDDGHL
jgi:DNA-binding SARP family transcriptional activator